MHKYLKNLPPPTSSLFVVIISFALKKYINLSIDFVAMFSKSTVSNAFIIDEFIISVVDTRSEWKFLINLIAFYG
jgi:hypothetical protein